MKSQLGINKLKVKKFNSSKEVIVKYDKYLIDWKKSGSSKLEVQFRDLIKPFWEHQIVLTQFRIPGSLMRIDFLNCNKKIAVEINGRQHEEFNSHFYSGKNEWARAIARDADKNQWCIDNKIEIVELDQKDLNKFSIDYVIKEFGVDLS